MTYNDTPKEVLKEGPTHEMLDRAISDLWGSITRFENALDDFEGGGKAVANKDKTEKERVTVVQTYRTAPSKIRSATERVHQLIDRLQNQFS